MSAWLRIRVIAGLKLYVGGLHYDLSETQLRDLFSPFGPLDKASTR